MTHQLKKLEQSQVELTFTIEPADYKKDLEAAAVRLSERAGIKGFRPGHAPYEVVKQQVGEAKIMEEALEHIIQKTFFIAVKEEKIETIGMPQIAVEKMAPGNNLVYRATVALLPKVTLADFNKIKVGRKPIEAGEKEVGEALEHLRKMQPKEIVKEGLSGKENKVTIDMDMFIDKVPVEGGQTKNHQVYLSEPHYIPGLAEELVGLKKADTKEFTLKFPKEHYQKHLAGRAVDFKIKVNDVFELNYPALDDELAKILGQENLEKLKTLLLANLTREAERKEGERVEIALLDALIEQSEFETIPQVLIDAEKRKMFYELKHSLDNQGIEMEKYLRDIKKTEKEIFDDFTIQGAKRAKAALLSRQVAATNNIVVEKAELDKEIASIKQAYPDDKNVEENLKRPEVIDTITATVQNRKVLEFLKKKILN